MKVKFILPALTEATSPFWRPIKYALFPPLGLMTLAAYLDDDVEVDIEDEHVEPLNLDDEPDLVAIEVYITSAYRAYELANHYRKKGAHVALGGLHVTALPQEAALYADTLFIGPGEDTWPAFLADYKAGHPGSVYRSRVRSLRGSPSPRRDLINRQRYLAPNSFVVSRGCPHKCEFCYKDSFFRGGRSFYTQPVDSALREIDRLPGRHLFFLDDNLFANPHFAASLFEGMLGLGRVWQAAGTLQAMFVPDLLEKAVASGLRSLFVGFETLNPSNLREQHKFHNLDLDYSDAVRRMHDLGVMINGSFVFGMDNDTDGVFDRTVDWALNHGLETATFHILTPYPGTALHRRLTRQNRIVHRNWDLYDTRHAVFVPKHMSGKTLEIGYERAYRNFYRWKSILRGTLTKTTWPDRIQHFAFTAGWKKFEPLWNMIIRTKQLSRCLPILENFLDLRTRFSPSEQTQTYHMESSPDSSLHTV